MSHFLLTKLSSVGHLLRNTRKLLRVSLREYMALTIILACLAIISSLLPFLQSGIVALLINNLSASISLTTQSSVTLIALLALITALPEFLTNLYSFFDRRYWIGMENHFQLAFNRKIAEMDITLLENPKFQDTLRRAEENFYSIMNFLHFQFNVTRSVTSLAAASVVIFLFDPLVFLIVAIGSLPGFITELRYGKGEWNIWGAKSEERRRFADLQRRMHSLNEIVELRIFQNVGLFYKKMKKLLDDFAHEQIQNESKRFSGNLLSFFSTLISIGGAVVLIMVGVSKGEIEIGTMTFVLYSVANFNTSLSGFFLSLAQQFKFSLYVTDIFTVLEQKNVRDTESQRKEKLGTSTPEITFENVSFKYPDSDTWVLKHFSLTIAPNERLALVGVNGAGKTTLVKLLARFYDPTEGRILVEGKDLKTIDIDVWYRKLAILFQDYATYNFLVKEGIALGDSREEISEENVIRAAKISDADAFIELWNKKYEQMIGKEFTEGVEPSKGQRQKLALARSFYRNPKILILDEPTASVDAEAEAKIFETLETLPREQTMILISHRFSTVRNADRICVIEGGKVSELGSHEELLEKNGTYARLFHKQAKGYK